MCTLIGKEISKEQGQMSDDIDRGLSFGREEFSELVPSVGSFGLGAVYGVCVGYAFKKISKEAAYFLGVNLLVIQGLRYLGVLEINWKRVHELFARVKKDAPKQMSHIKHEVLPMNIGVLGGFAAGMVLLN